MRVLGATVLGVLVLAALPAAAAAEPWEASYRWQASSATGFEGWTAYDTNPDSGLGGPWYRLWLGGSPFGRGAAAQPIGGRTYDNGDRTRETGAPSGRIVYAAPGRSRIVSGRFDDMQLRDEDEGQYLRARIYGPTDAQRATRDFGAAYGQPSGVTHDLGPVDVEPSEPGTTAEAWLFTVCRPDPGTGVFMCPDVPSGSDSFGRFGTIELTLEDPDDPEIQIDAQPPIGDGWINERRTQRLTARATDPSSGIERIRVQLRRGQTVRTLTDREAACDPRHRTPGRDGLVCSATASATATDPARDSSSRAREYVVTAWDYAGNQAQQTVTVRRDVTRPSSGRLSGELTELARDWTNRQGDVPVTLRGRDGQSGVARLELIADRVAGGRPTVLAASQPTCERGCTSASETTTARLDRDTLPRDGRYRLSVRVTDRAGNQREFRSASTLKLDRAAPRRAGRAPFYRILRDGRVRVHFQPGRDPRESSGLGDFIVRYTPRDPNPAGGAAIRFASVRMAAAPVVNYKKSRYRTLTLRGVDLNQPLAATQAGCDDARNGTPQPQYGGASANCSELVVLEAANDGTRRCYFEIRPRRNTVIRQDARRHIAENRRAGFYINPAACGPNVVLAASGRVSVRLNGRLILKREINYVRTSGSVPKIDMSWTCRPSMDGTKRYHVRLVALGGVAQLPSGEQVPIIPAPPTTRSIYPRCPTTQERQSFEFTAWRDLGRYNPKTRRLLSEGTRAGSILARNIAPLRPFQKPARVLDAHHIVPARDSDLRARLIQAGAFRCGLFPNDVRNGVWLRSFRARKGTKAYTRMPGSRQRTWHPLTYFPRYKGVYLARLRRSLTSSGAIESNGSCGNSGKFASNLRRVRDHLIRGTYLPGRLEANYRP